MIAKSKRGRHMKDTARTVLTEAGINVDTAVKTFLDDEEMYFEFLNSFVEDTLMSRLKQAVQNGSVDDAFEAGTRAERLMRQFKH